jgi:hypothetical protein
MWETTSRVASARIIRPLTALIGSCAVCSRTSVPVPDGSRLIWKCVARANPGCRLAVEPLGDVSPAVRAGRVVLGDLAVHLGGAGAPTAVLALGLAHALVAVEHLDALGEGEPLRCPLRFGHHRPHLFGGSGNLPGTLYLDHDLPPHDLPPVV